MQYGLSEHIIEKIIGIIKNYAEVDEAVLYGSRANGTYKNGSAIDLGLKGNDIAMDTVNSISGQLNELNIPYMVNVSDLADINNADLLEHIDREGVRWYKK